MRVGFLFPANISLQMYINMLNFHDAKGQKGLFELQMNNDLK